MNAIVFTGPTISRDEAADVLEAEYRPPAAEGDLYRAAVRRPHVIGLIDGYFERLPAVWHKEILWAMSHGIHVVGSASMGALRAAELSAFGMEGVGRVFEDFQSGALDDDDEVAVAHAGAEQRFRPMSEAMVDIRATLARAVAECVISRETAALMEALAKRTFYPERRYASMCKAALLAGVPQAQVTAFREWLPSGRFSQKREDALAMLKLIHERMASGLEPKHVRYFFENSSIWERARRRAGEQHDGVDGAVDVTVDAIVDELRLEGRAYRSAEDATLMRQLAIAESHRRGMADLEHLVLGTRRDFVKQRELTESGLAAWLRANDLDERRFEALVEDEARVRWIRDLTAPQLWNLFLDQLRVSGSYPRLVERARAKQRALAAAGLNEPALVDVGLDEQSLFRWYFEERLGEAVPVDLRRYSDALGFDSLDAFRLAVLREYCYLRNLAAG